MSARWLCAVSVCATAACVPVDPITGYPVEEGDHGGEVHVGRAPGYETAPSEPRVTRSTPMHIDPDASAPVRTAHPTPGAPSSDAVVLETQEGDASWYSDSLAGGPTASGERYSPRALTAAHLRLPLGTWVRVTRRDTGATVVVRINDRGPYGSARRIIDLSRRAAEELRMIRRGVAPIRLEVLRYGEGRARRRSRRRH